MNREELARLIKQTIFQEPPEDINETWIHGALLGGMLYDVYKTLDIADAFKLAGDTLVDQVLSGNIEAYQIFYPILYNYRHALELYIKSCLPGAKGHDLKGLITKLETAVQEKYKDHVSGWFKKWIMEFDEFDKNSDMFRYADKNITSKDGDIGEFWIDFSQLQKIMSLYKECFYLLVNDMK